MHTENVTCLCRRQCHWSSVAAAVTPRQVLENGVLMGFWPEMSSGAVWNVVPRELVEYLEAILGFTASQFNWLQNDAPVKYGSSLAS